jgi:hypothetical protein
LEAECWKQFCIGLIVEPIPDIKLQDGGTGSKFVSGDSLKASVSGEGLLNPIFGKNLAALLRL